MFIVLPTTKINRYAFDDCYRLSNESKFQIFYDINNLTLSENFQKGDGPILNFQGATQKGYGPEMWGLTLEQIKFICQHPLIKPEATMREVVEVAIKPITKGLGISYALLVNQYRPLRAKVMVSVSYCTNDNAPHFAAN